jgi:hypothetical protein
MKLTEQQLAQLFQQNKDTPVESVINDLNNFGNATDARLNAVEKIANNSTLSASQQIINNIEDWSKAIALKTQAHIRPTLTTQIFKWLRPTVAVAAVVTAVYFMTPINQHETKATQITNQLSIQTQKPDRIMYSSSFEKGSKSIQTKQQDSKSDVISKFNFS